MTVVISSNGFVFGMNPNKRTVLTNTPKTSTIKRPSKKKVKVSKKK